MTIIDILRDPVWQFIGAVLGAIAIILALSQRRHKAMACRIDRMTVISPSAVFEGKVQILYLGKPVRDVQLIAVWITNTGNIPIASHDYERPVSIFVGEESSILEAGVVETNPPSLQPSTTISETSIEIAPALLNPGDSMTIKMLVSNLTQLRYPLVSGRIIGVKDITDMIPKNRWAYWASAIFVELIALAVFMWGLVVYGERNGYAYRGTLNERPAIHPWFEVFLIVAMVIALVGLLPLMTEMRVFTKDIQRQLRLERNTVGAREGLTRSDR